MKLFVDRITHENELFNLIKEEYSFTDEDIYYLESGKPMVRGDKIYFSKSHSGEYVVFAVSDRPIGIDIELIREIDAKVLEVVMNKCEIAYILENKELVNRRFFEIWTKKEAYIKCYGKYLKDMLLIDTNEHEYQINYDYDGYIIVIYEEVG